MLLDPILFSGQSGSGRPSPAGMSVMYYVEPVTGFMLIDTPLVGRERAPSALPSRHSDSSRPLRLAPFRSRSSPGMTRSSPCSKSWARITSARRARRGCRRFPGHRRCTHLRNCIDPGDHRYWPDRWAFCSPAPFSQKPFFPGPASANGWSNRCVRRDYPSVLQGGVLLIASNGDDGQSHRRCPVWPHQSPNSDIRA